MTASTSLVAGLVAGLPLVRRHVAERVEGALVQHRLQVARRLGHRAKRQAKAPLEEEEVVGGANTKVPPLGHGVEPSPSARLGDGDEADDLTPGRVVLQVCVEVQPRGVVKHPRVGTLDVFVKVTLVVQLRDCWQVLATGIERDWLHFAPDPALS